MPTMLDRWTVDAVAKTETKTRIETVLMFLRAKINDVPAEIEEAIFGMSDSIALEALAAQVMQCSTIDEFAEALL